MKTVVGLLRDFPKISDLCKEGEKDYAKDMIRLKQMKMAFGILIGLFGFMAFLGTGWGQTGPGFNRNPGRFQTNSMEAAPGGIGFNGSPAQLPTSPGGGIGFDGQFYQPQRFLTPSPNNSAGMGFEGTPGRTNIGFSTPDFRIPMNDQPVDFGRPVPQEF